MDLNYLLHRHQVSLANAANAACEDSRRAHLSLVAAYAERIERSAQGPVALVAEEPLSDERARPARDGRALKAASEQFGRDSLRIAPGSLGR